MMPLRFARATTADFVWRSPERFPFVKLKHLACVAATLATLQQGARAQLPTPTAVPGITATPVPAGNIADSLQVAVTSASGAERHPHRHDGIVDRIGLRPNQVVTVGLQFLNRNAGELVNVGAIDGGEVIAAQGGLTLSAAGLARFSFQGGRSPGLYRVSVRVGALEYRLQFYVLDLNHPQNNPPRIRIVD